MPFTTQLHLRVRQPLRQLHLFRRKQDDAADFFAASRSEMICPNTSSGITRSPWKGIISPAEYDTDRTPKQHASLYFLYTLPEMLSILHGKRHISVDDRSTGGTAKATASPTENEWIAALCLASYFPSFAQQLPHNSIVLSYELSEDNSHEYHQFQYSPVVKHYKYQHHLRTHWHSVHTLRQHQQQHTVPKILPVQIFPRYKNNHVKQYKYQHHLRTHRHSVRTLLQYQQQYEYQHHLRIHRHSVHTLRQHQQQHTATSQVRVLWQNEAVDHQ